MPAPAAVNIHGSADSLNDIEDEANIDIQEFKANFSREQRDRKNRHGNLRRREYFNPLVAISFTGFFISAAGLATQHPGTRVVSLVNFAVETRGMDPAVGTMMLDDAEDTKSLEEDLKTSMNITHAPFVITA
jgi:hypothetical protein